MGDFFIMNIFLIEYEPESKNFHVDEFRHELNKNLEIILSLGEHCAKYLPIDYSFDEEEAHKKCDKYMEEFAKKGLYIPMADMCERF